MSAGVLLTGATGFVGGRLHGPLEAEGFRVRCLSRNIDAARRMGPGWEWVKGDVGDYASLVDAMSGCSIAYYLVHGMTGGTAGWAERELAWAASFARAAEAARVERIVYLGGTAPAANPSAHLRSRLETGRVLREGAVPCLELRATMIIGHGSASWRMVRDLAARLPAMVLPAWLKHRTEPVAIDDVVQALVRGATVPLSASDWADLPGPELLTGREILTRVAALLGHRPAMFEVPFVTPRLSSYWIRLVSGVDFKLAQELVEGLTSDLIAQRRDYWEQAGLASPMRLEAAASRALAEDLSASAPATLLLEQFIGRVTRHA